MKIYTKTGDSGTTSLVGGTRVPKNSPRLNAYGTIDELNSWIGYILSFPIADKTTSHILTVTQHLLFDIGSALATEINSKWRPAEISDKDFEAIESEIDRLDAILPHHDKFILPGGTQLSSVTNIARTVTRRAEREILSLEPDTCPGQVKIVKFVNRLSDYLFVLSRYFNFLAKQHEIFWDNNCSY